MLGDEKTKSLCPEEKSIMVLLEHCQDFRIIDTSCKSFLCISCRSRDWDQHENWDLVCIGIPIGDGYYFVSRKFIWKCASFECLHWVDIVDYTFPDININEIEVELCQEFLIHDGSHILSGVSTHEVCGTRLVEVVAGLCMEPVILIVACSQEGE